MKKSPPEPESTGTRIGEKVRAKANGYSEARRQELLHRGRELAGTPIS